MKTFDIVRIIDTDEFAIVATVTSRGFSVTYFKQTRDLSPFKVNKTAWFTDDEVELLGNAVEVMGRMAVDSSCSDIKYLEAK